MHVSYHGLLSAVGMYAYIDIRIPDSEISCAALAVHQSLHSVHAASTHLVKELAAELRTVVNVDAQTRVQDSNVVLCSFEEAFHSSVHLHGCNPKIRSDPTRTSIYIVSTSRCVEREQSVRACVHTCTQHCARALPTHAGSAGRCVERE